jgi:hypothetical protein
MHACTGCGELWGAWLSACPRCKGELRRWGTEPADFDHPTMVRFPMRKALRQQTLGTPLGVELFGEPPAPKPVRKRARARKAPAKTG